jgi:hypothetical protein
MTLYPALEPGRLERWIAIPTESDRMKMSFALHHLHHHYLCFSQRSDERPAEKTLGPGSLM